MISKEEKIGYIVSRLLDVEVMIIQCLYNYLFEDGLAKDKRSFFVLNMIYAIPAYDKLKILKDLEVRLNFKENEVLHKKVKSLIEIRNIVCHSITTYGKSGHGLIGKEKLRDFIKGDKSALNFDNLFEEFDKKYKAVKKVLMKYADFKGAKIKAKKQDARDTSF